MMTVHRDFDITSRILSKHGFERVEFPGKIGFQRDSYLVFLNYNGYTLHTHSNGIMNVNGIQYQSLTKLFDDTETRL